MKLPKELKDKRDLTSEMNKGKNCSIKGCNDVAIRSLSENKWKSYLEKADLKYLENKQKKIFLCKNHYKEVNKLRRSQEKLYQKKGFLEDSFSIGKIKRYD
ncbi:MAG: hypothetical protein ACFE8V_02210 [Promethearchaeota archaeon]